MIVFHWTWMGSLSFTEQLSCLCVSINFYPNSRVCWVPKSRRGKWVDDWHEQMNTVGVKTPLETGLVLCDWWVRGTYGGVGGWKLFIKACVSCWWVLGHLRNALKGWDVWFILLISYIVSLSGSLFDVRLGLAVVCIVFTICKLNGNSVLASL